MKAKRAAVRNRIKELRYVRGGDLVPHPSNYRVHGTNQLQALRAILKDVGIAAALVGRELPGGKVQIIDGHARAGVLPDEKLPVLILDVDEQEAAKLLATLDPLSAMAGIDGDALKRVLEAAKLEDEALLRMVDGLLPKVDPKEGLADADAVPEPPEKPVSKRGDLWILGEHRLLCGDSAKAEDVDRLLDGAKVHLVCTDPPYGVKVEPRSNNAIAAGLSSFQAKHHQKLDVSRHPEKAKPTHRRMRAKDRPLENDFLPEEEFARLLLAWFGNVGRVLMPGGSFYIWGGYANCGNYPPALKASGLYFSQAIIWNKLHPVLTRKDFMGAHEWCQPPGTRVLTPEGDVPIESLRDGDRVVSYSTHNAMILGRRRGYAVRRAERRYAGTLYGVAAAGKTTWATDGHLWSARMTPAARRYWCVYLMRRGTWWRVGRSKLYTSWGFGPKQRLMFEGGEEAWILSLHGSNVDAGAAEQMASVRYGIPTTYWRLSQAAVRPEAEIRRMYDSLDANMLAASAYRALLDHHRRIEYPLLRREASLEKVGARVPFIARTCNLLPEVMAVPVPTLGTRFAWTPVDEVVRNRFDGTVHSLDVEKNHHYVADGLVTHNCFYGWKEGAGHRFFGPANVPDIWDVKKIPPQQMNHLTAKPVELAARAVEYSSRRGENVLDLFAGGGSTLVAAEQLGRRSFNMEIDPAYVDVVVARFEAFTGKKAKRAKR